MLNTEIKEDRLIVGNTDYPRARAESVVLGTYGKMVKAASPLFGGIQSIEEYGRWIIPEELVVGVEKMSISQDSVRSLVAKVSAEATQIQAVGAKGNVSLQSVGSTGGTLSFVAAEISFEDLLKQINKTRDASAYKYLENNKTRGRIISKVFSVVDADLTSAMHGEVEFDVEVEDRLLRGVSGGSELKASGKATVTLRISAGTTIAYEMAQPIWKGNEVVSLEHDDGANIFTE